jgi:hypothetical protein
MMRDERSLVVGGWVLLVAACSAGKPPAHSDDDTGGSSSGGTGVGGAAASGTGGANPNGGGSATAGAGATTPTGGASTGGEAGAGGMGATGTGGATAGSSNGGAAGAGAVPAGGDAGVGGQVACQDLTVVPTPLVPAVAIVVDNSSSMYEPSRTTIWDPLYDALMNPTTGAIKPLEGKVRFGFSTFRSPDGTSVPETDPSCAQMVNVPYAVDNYDEINTVYQSVGLDGRRPQGCGATPNAQGCGETQWDTPSGHALGRVATALGALTADPPGPKYMLFVTDGTPNTCLVQDPNCGQDQVLKSVQDAHAAGIGTFVIGVGRIATTEMFCDPAAMRCGTDHLQDIANAGSGQPVTPPPMSYWYQQCAARQSNTNPGTPLATYAMSGEAAGTATYYTATTAVELRNALTTLLSNVVSCTIQLDATVNATANPALARITVGGNAVTYDTADGWILEPTRDKITLQGAACMTFRGGAPVNVVFPCQNGRPIGT